MKKKSASLHEMLRSRRGYRCEGYSGSQVRRADKVVHFETFELGNPHVLVDVCRAIRKKKCDWDEHWLFNELEDELKKFDALWLTTRTGAERYCEGDEPEEYQITSDMIPACDLGTDGTLFLTRRMK